MSRLKKIVGRRGLTDYETFALQALVDKAERDAGHTLSLPALQALADDYLASLGPAQRQPCQARSKTKGGRVRQQQADPGCQDYRWQPGTPARHLRKR